MYAMCHTKSDDVLACIHEMRKRNIKYPIFQVGQKLYKRCEKDRGKASEIAGNKKRHYAINMTTRMIHRENCEIIKRSNPDCIIGAYLVRPKDTGLKMCKHCMS